MSAALPAAPIVSGEYRALTLFDAAPEGHILWPVQDESADPHLKPGEYGVIDTADRQPVAGELFLIEWNSGRRSYVQTNVRRFGGDPVWMTDPLNRPRGAEELQRWLRERRPIYTSDGPYPVEYLACKLVGRVVGVVIPSPGALR
jgi:hypothetical protein